MDDFSKWFVLSFVLLRWIALGYVISKHGEEKPIDKYNALTHIFTTSIWCVILYSLWF